MEREKGVDIAIIGAGISGLSAAYRIQQLTKRETTLAVLEAKERVGGRTCRISLSTNSGVSDWDIGGQWVSSSQLSVLGLLEELKIEVFPQHDVGKNRVVMYNLSDVRHYSNLIPPLSIMELLDLNHFLNKVEKMALDIPLENPLQCVQAREWDDQTLQSFAETTCKFSVNMKLLATISRAVFGMEPSQISLFYFLYYCSLAGGFNMLLETKSGAAQQFRVKNTIARVADILHERVGFDCVHCNDPVNRLEQVDGKCVIITTEKGWTYKAKYVICAIPPHLVNQISFQPPLPFNRLQIGSHMPVGNLIKFVATYQTAFWRNKGDSGESVMILDRASVGPLCATYDATSFDGAPAIVGFIGGEHAIYWTNKSKEEREKGVIECLVGIFGEKAESQLIQYGDKDWCREPFNGGCPASVMQPGCLVYFHQALREPFCRIHWAGTETARKWTGYIDGAVESGFRAAGEVIDRINSGTELIKQKSFGGNTISPIFGSNYSWQASTEKGGLTSKLALSGIFLCSMFCVYKYQNPFDYLLYCL